MRQVQALANQTAIVQEYILPIALKAVGTSEILLVEFAVIPKADVTSITGLEPVAMVVYTLVPPVPGIGA